MAVPEEQIITEVTQKYLSDMGTTLIDAHTMRAELIDATNNHYVLENAARRPGNRIVLLKTLTTYQVAELLLARYNIMNIKLSGSTKGSQSSVKTDNDGSLLAVYESEGFNAGVYVDSLSRLRTLARVLSPSISDGDLRNVIQRITDAAPVTEPESNPVLVAVSNGVFNTDTKMLSPHSPERVFMSKSKVDYVANAPNPMITMPDGEPWDVVSWVNDLSDDAGVPELLWEVLSASVRPNVSWNRAAFFYSTHGNNGKGSLCALMRELVGEGSHASISIADFATPFMLEPLVRASCVIVDENDVGIFLDGASFFKAAVTGDVFLCNPKNKAPFTMRFRGLIVQCVNDFFKTKDKSDSFARRQLFIPFPKNFKGVERKYIKEDYLKRSDVLEYVLWRVLQMNHTSLSTPDVCLELLGQYREHNDPVRAFWAKFEDEFAWSLLPFNFLYQLYREWMTRENPGGGAVSATKFTQSIKVIAEENGVWTAGLNAQTKHRSKNHMGAAEPLSVVYKLEEWMSTTYTGANVMQRGAFMPLDSYRGLKRT